ncbi:MAG: TonB-dependent receptor, partial [Candidatus Omnitrophota bacterium]
DPIDGNRSFDFANLITDNIERIEVVRGPQSTLYGSDAMAGVINIITKKGTGKPKVEGYFEGGSHNTFRENFGLSGIALDKLDYSFSATRFDSDGISAAEGGSENDPYHNITLSSRVGYEISDSAKLSLVAHYTDAKKSIDTSDNLTYALIDMQNYTSWSKDLSTKFAFDQSINSWWTHTLSFSYHDIRRKDKKEWDPVNLDNVNDWYKGDNKKVEWQHNFSPVKWNILTAGLEYEDETGSSYYYINPDPYGYTSKQNRKSVDNMGYYFQDQLKVWDKLFITPGIRIDDNELFGTETTYKVSAAYIISETGTRLKANWGTGFKAPSLFQLYSTYGSPDMMPEKSKSYDFGFEQSFLKDKLSFDLTYFHNDFKDMIDYNYASSKYKNVGKAVTKGFEFGTKFIPFNTLTLAANFTYTDTEDKETGLELLRRPQRQLNFDANWAFMPNANLNFGANYVGSRKDSGYVTDKAYTIFRMAASYEITKNLQVFGRIENLFDKKYQEVYGYETMGRSFYAGIKGSF